VAGCVALVAVLGACSGSKTPAVPYVAPQGVSEKEIVFGTHQPLTGPAAAGYSKIAAATKAYFDYVNAKGGVHGRKIIYRIEDDGYNPANTQTVVRKLVEQDKVFAILNGLGTPTHSAVLSYLKDAEIPDLFVSSGSPAWNQPGKYPGTFAFQPDYTTEAKVVGHYLKTASAFAGQKICSFAQDDDYGASYLTGLETGLGTPVTARATYVTSNPNVAPQVDKLRDAGCDVVVLATIPSFTARFISTAAKLGWRPQYVAAYPAGEYGTVAATLGDEKDLLEGMVGAGFLPAVANVSDPWIKLFTRINQDFNGGVAFDGHVLYGMAVGYLVVQVLQKAGREITVDKLIATLEKGGFRGPGLVPFSYSATSHAGYAGVRLSKVTGGVQDYFGPAYVTDAGSAPVTEYTEATATPPDSGIPSA
jgi:branched-chain amino acid transport system substrate-binding protein